MPNWCEGYLRIMGEWEDILSFLTNDLDLPDGGTKKDIKIILPYYDDEDAFELDITNYGAHIRGTRRGFIRPINEVYYKRKESPDVIALPSKFAWDIDVEGLRKLSEERSLNLRIYAFESGMQFNRDIEILKGKITKNDTIKFVDYEWECIDPYKGG